LFPLAGRSAGVYVVEESVGFTGRKWGIHVGVPGEGYLYMGLLGASGLGAAWGIVGSCVTRWYGRDKVHPVVFSILSWYMLRIFFEGSEKFAEMITVLAPTIVITSFLARRQPEVSSPVAPTA